MPGLVASTSRLQHRDTLPVANHPFHAIPIAHPGDSHQLSLRLLFTYRAEIDGIGLHAPINNTENLCHPWAANQLFNNTPTPLCPPCRPFAMTRSL